MGWKYFLAILAGCLLFISTPKQVMADKPEPNSMENAGESQENQVQDEENDAIVPVYIRKRLENPDYDVRYENGTIQPWHDTRSIYPYRKILLSRLA